MSLSPKDIAEFDQGARIAIDSLPQFWFSLYEKCLEVGFTEQQAMMLLIEWNRHAGRFREN